MELFALMKDYTKYMNANFRSSGLAANTIARYF